MKLLLILTCPLCHSKAEVEVSGHQLALLRSGELIQNVFPDMDASTRERIKTGICPKCWDKIMQEEEYDEEYK